MPRTGNTQYPLVPRTIQIDTDLSTKQYHFVDFDATDDSVVNLTADALTQPFVLTTPGNGATGAIEGEILLIGTTLLKLAGTVSAGAFLTATTGGEAIATTTDGDYYGAIALYPGVDGDLIEVLVQQGTVSNPA
jgi:hypothetical protein